MIEREDVVEMMDRVFDENAVHPVDPKDARLYTIRTTSGTSGRGPLVSLRKHPPVISARHGQYRSFLATYGSRGLRLAQILFAWNAESGPRAIAAFGGVDDLKPGLADLINDLAPDSISGTPSRTLQVMNGTTHETRAKVAHMVVAGELISASLDRQLHTQFPHASINVMFMSTEMSTVGVGVCPHLARNNFHPAEGVVIEMFNTDDEGVGELLVSRFVEPGGYVTRYRTGDVIRWLQKPCPCGNPDTFEVLGRAGFDYIKGGGMVLRVEEVERVLAQCGDLFDDYRVSVHGYMHDSLYQGGVTITLYRQKGALSAKEEDRVRVLCTMQLHVAPHKTYGSLVREGLLAPLVVKSTTIPFPLTHKHIRMAYES